MKLKITLAVFFGMLSIPVVADQATVYQSDRFQTPLIELYTSEGCSSCPPADRWLSALKNHEQLWLGFVPLAFHVDYWDYIGWKDRFASKAFSERQRRYAVEQDENVVYTPGVRKAGAEWRNWRRGADLLAGSRQEVGVLRLAIDIQSGFTAHFDDLRKQPVSSLQLNIAVLGMGLQSEVTRGENRGKTLLHDFVVLDMITVSSADTGRWSGTLPRPSINAPHYALAAWVSESGRLMPLQSTGGLMPEGYKSKVP